MPIVTYVYLMLTQSAYIIYIKFLYGRTQAHTLL